MKKKITALMIATAMLVSMMASCTITITKKDKDNDVSSDSTSSYVVWDYYDWDYDTSSEDVSSAPSVNVDDIDISDDWKSWQIALDGVVYTIPCDVSEFEKNGWTLDGKDESLEPNHYTLAQKLYKGDNYIYVQVLNETSKTITTGEGKISQVDVDGDDDVSLVLPGGLVFDKNLTVETIKAKYGEPTSEYVYDDWVALIYRGDRAYQSIHFSIYTDESKWKYSDVSIQNVVS